MKNTSQAVIENLRTFTIIFALMSFSITPTRAEQISIRQLPKGATISLFEGLNTASSAPMRAREGDVPPLLWEAVGIVQFFSSDSSGDYDGIPISSSSPSQTDLAGISILQTASWKDPSGNSYTTTLAKSSFADRDTVREFRKIGELGEPHIPGGVSYRYSLSLRGLSAQILNPLFSLQGDIDNLSMFEMNVALEYQLKRRNGQSEQIRIQCQPRKVMVLDTVEAELKMLNPPENAFPLKGTSGDPLGVSDFRAQILDTNPNQQITDMTLSTGDEEISMSPGPEQRDYTANPTNPPWRFKSDHSASLSTSNPVFLPENGGEGKLTLTCTPRYPRIPPQRIVKEYPIEIEDNDAPAITVKISYESPGEDKNIEASVKGGEKDIPAEGSGLIQVSITGSGSGAGTQTQDPYHRAPGADAPSAAEAESMILDLATLFQNKTDWLAVPEDTRVFITLTATDNFDDPGSPGSNIASYTINDKPHRGGRSSMIFRNGGASSNSLKVTAADRNGNIRTVKIPFRVIDTKMNVQTIR
jgi:hypothetical protein